MKDAKTNPPRRQTASRRNRKASDQLKSFLAMSPHVVCRDADLFPQGQGGPVSYDPEKIYVRADYNEKLVRKAVELRESGATYVMVHSKSVSGRFSIKPETPEPGFRVRRLDLRFNLEMKA
ncbi:hypothetical protein ACFJIS_17705 [Variovorax boronicumulans]|uniref:hypothetical protein n=1 Tax=Variovorax boronicumulans TaxID=436515 RepID=UPI0036F3514F